MEDILVLIFKELSQNCSIIEKTQKINSILEFWNISTISNTFPWEQRLIIGNFPGINVNIYPDAVTIISINECDGRLIFKRFYNHILHEMEEPLYCQKDFVKTLLKNLLNKSKSSVWAISRDLYTENWKERFNDIILDIEFRRNSHSSYGYFVVAITPKGQFKFDINRKLKNAFLTYYKKFTKDHDIITIRVS